MRCILRHILWMTSMACLVMMLVACHDETGLIDDTPESDETVMLILNTDVIRASRYTETDLPNEKMRTLRTVILHQDGTVEHNKFLDFGENAQTDHSSQLFRVKPNETKVIYLIANERNVNGLQSEKLNAFEVGSNGFKDYIDDLSFIPSYNLSIPMSAKYDLEIKEKEQECQFYLVRAATKFTFRFNNMRAYPVKINSVTVSEIAEQTYLMPHKKTPTMLFTEENGTEKEYFWIDWLQKVTDESQVNPDDKELTDKRGWIMDYDIPQTISKAVTINAPTNFQVVGITYDAGVPKSGTAVYPVFYLPESKNLKSDEKVDGEQEYTMTVNLIDNKDNTPHSFSCPFDNLKALFRNTHVVVDVNFLEKGITVDVIPYSEVILEPEFGLDYKSAEPENP